MTSSSSQARTPQELLSLDQARETIGMLYKICPEAEKVFSQPRLNSFKALYRSTLLKVAAARPVLYARPEWLLEPEESLLVSAARMHTILLSVFEVCAKTCRNHLTQHQSISSLSMHIDALWSRLLPLHLGADERNMNEHDQAFGGRPVIVSVCEELKQFHDAFEAGLMQLYPCESVYHLEEAIRDPKSHGHAFHGFLDQIIELEAGLHLTAEAMALAQIVHKVERACLRKETALKRFEDHYPDASYNKKPASSVIADLFQMHADRVLPLDLECVNYRRIQSEWMNMPKTYPLYLTLIRLQRLHLLHELYNAVKLFMGGDDQRHTLLQECEGLFAAFDPFAEPSKLACVRDRFAQLFKSMKAAQALVQSKGAFHYFDCHVVTWLGSLELLIIIASAPAGWASSTATPRR
jgi:hypothetical protein